MHSRFDQFRERPLGIQLENFFKTPTRYAECAALARAGVASVVAISHELAERFPEVHRDVAGVVFTYGAVFTAFPAPRDYSALVSLLSDFPERVRSLIHKVPERVWTKRPDGSGVNVDDLVGEIADHDSTHQLEIEELQEEFKLGAES